uniref:Uncharacterized protein n=1 Tax=Denticeps clupeoides TaxID=299321 RepID=A0AAY4EMC6_9TELE
MCVPNGPVFEFRLNVFSLSHFPAIVCATFFFTHFSFNSSRAHHLQSILFSFLHSPSDSSLIAIMTFTPEDGCTVCEGVSSLRLPADEISQFLSFSFVAEVPVNRVLPPGSIPVDAYSFKYIIVPDTDDCHSETLKKSLEILSQQFTPPLEGLIGSQSIPSLADLKQQLTNCSAFIFYNTERFLAWIPPAKLAVLNMADCKMAILFDLVQNNSQRDIHKSASKLFLEPDLETVLLLSAVGVSSIMMNQWCSTTQANAHNLCTVMEGLMKMGLTSGQTVHSLHLKGPQSSKTDGSVLNVRDTVKKDSPSPSALNFIIYGLPNVVIT